MNNFVFSNFQNAFFQKLTASVWKSFELNDFSPEVKLLLGQPSFEEIATSLLKKEISGAIFPLSQIPLDKPKGVVITALPVRLPADEIVLVKKSISEKGEMLNLPEGASVSVFTKMQKAQILHFRPDLKIIELNFDYFYKVADLEFESDAMILPAAFAENFDHDHISFPLQASEFVPSPGQGVLAFLSLKENIPIRRFLKKFHKKEISACTNIERAIQSKSSSAVAVFCKKNNQGHYEINAVSEKEGNLSRFNSASSTSLGLADQVLSEIC